VEHLAAAREVGVSRTAGHNRSQGYKTYQHGQVTGFVPALDRLAVREISGRFLSQDERIEARPELGGCREQGGYGSDVGRDDVRRAQAGLGH
jgi:hypothetical protein